MKTRRESPQAGSPELVLLLVLVAGGIAGCRWLKVREITDSSVFEGQNDRGKLTEAAMFDLNETGILIGSPDAAVTVTVFFDFSCGWCKAFESVVAAVSNRYPDHLAFVFKEMTDTTGNTLMLHAAARCAAVQGEGTTFRRLAFEHSSVTLLRNGWREVLPLLKMPEPGRFERCVRRREFADLVRRNVREASELGVNVTPTILIGGVQYRGMMEASELDSLVADELNRTVRQKWVAPSANE